MMMMSIIVIIIITTLLLPLPLHYYYLPIAKKDVSSYVLSFSSILPTIKPMFRVSISSDNDDNDDYDNETYLQLNRCSTPQQHVLQ